MRRTLEICGFESHWITVSAGSSMTPQVRSKTWANAVTWSCNDQVHSSKALSGDGMPTSLSSSLQKLTSEPNWFWLYVYLHWPRWHFHQPPKRNKVYVCSNVKPVQISIPKCQCIQSLTTSTTTATTICRFILSFFSLSQRNAFALY